MSQGPLLLMVQSVCPQEHLETFTRWYNSHLPNLLRIPGYLWAQRYIGLHDSSRFVALYGVRSEEDLPNLLQWDGPALHPIAKAEYDAFPRLPGISFEVQNVYEQITGTALRNPFLCSDRPLSVVSTEPDPTIEEEWDRWYTESHVPNLLKIPGYAMAGRFRAIEHPAIAKFNTGPKYLALYECEGEKAVESLRDGSNMSAAAQDEFAIFRRDWLPRTRNVSWGFYKMISKHFKLSEGEADKGRSDLPEG